MRIHAQIKKGGGGCSEPPLRFPVWIFDGRRGQGGHGLWKTGK